MDKGNTTIENLYEIGDSLYYLAKYEEAIVVYKSALALFSDRKRSGNYLYSNLNSDIGLSFKKQNKYDSAIFYYQEALIFDQFRKDTARMAGRMRNLGILHSEVGLLAEALKYYLDAIEIVEGSYPIKKARLQINIGNIFLKESKFAKALDSYRQALSVMSAYKREMEVSLLYNNIGYTYFKLGDEDSASIYLLSAINRPTQTSDLTMCHALDNMGLLLLKKGNLDSAKSYLDRSHQISSKAQMTHELTDNEIIISEYYLKSGKLDSAMEKVFNAISFSNRVNSLPLKIRAYEVLIKIYNEVGDHYRASNFQGELMTLKEDQFQEDLDRLNEVRFNYIIAREQELKESALSEAVLAEMETSKQRIYSFTLGFLLVIMGIGGLVIIRQRNTLKHTNFKLSDQKLKIEMLNKQNFHFTKNSLTGVVGMLNKQFKYVKDPQVLSFLVEEKLRMETVNVLYSQVFNNPTGFVNLKDFLTNIIDNTTSSFFDQNEISIIINIKKDIELANEKAFPLGLVINEICVNACKYASVADGIKVRLEIRRNGSEELKVVFSDQGPGFPKGFEWKDSNSFGLTLIKLFIEELSGQLEVLSSKSGLVYEINFNFQE